MTSLYWSLFLTNCTVSGSELDLRDTFHCSKSTKAPKHCYIYWLINQQTAPAGVLRCCWTLRQQFDVFQKNARRALEVLMWENISAVGGQWLGFPHRVLWCQSGSVSLTALRVSASTDWWTSPPLISVPSSAPPPPPAFFRKWWKRTSFREIHSLSGGMRWVCKHWGCVYGFLLCAASVENISPLDSRFRKLYHLTCWSKVPVAFPGKSDQISITNIQYTAKNEI